MDNNQQPENRESKKPRHRSPNYPTVGLREAVTRVRKLYAADGKAGAPAELAAVHIGFAKPHGQAMSVLAALKKFGLLAEINGRWVPSQRAIEILNLPETDERRIRALRDAAQSPDLYRELIDAHRETGWPKDDVLESELVTYRNFNPNSVGTFVKDLRDSLDFAGLSDLTALKSEKDENKDEPEGITPPKVGDYVQWESQGVIQFTEPRRVREISDDGEWAFVEGSNTGVPVKELTTIEQPANPAGEQLLASIPPRPRTMVEPQKMPIVPPVATGMRQDVFSLAEGQVTIQWPTALSPESFQDLGDWLDILKRKIGRSVGSAIAKEGQ